MLAEIQHDQTRRAASPSTSLSTWVRSIPGAGRLPSSSSFWDFRMHSELPGEVVGPAQVKPIVEFREVSKWYGNVIGINKLTINVPAGVTGLLGPNGAGKSTLLQLATGQLFPSQGRFAFLVGRSGIALR